jgi:hypothetical protein
MCLGTRDPVRRLCPYTVDFKMRGQSLPALVHFVTYGIHNNAVVFFQSFCDIGGDANLSEECFRFLLSEMRHHVTTARVSCAL